MEFIYVYLADDEVIPDFRNHKKAAITMNEESSEQTSELAKKKVSNNNRFTS